MDEVKEEDKEKDVDVHVTPFAMCIQWAMIDTGPYCGELQSCSQAVLLVAGLAYHRRRRLAVRAPGTQPYIACSGDEVRGDHATWWMPQLAPVHHVTPPRRPTRPPATPAGPRPPISPLASTRRSVRMRVSVYYELCAHLAHSWHQAYLVRTRLLRDVRLEPEPSIFCLPLLNLSI